jgi:hypothetical protein
MVLWYIDIRKDNHVNYNKYSLLLGSQTIREAQRTQCTPAETPLVVGLPELVTAVMMSCLLCSTPVTAGPCKGLFVRSWACLLDAG